MLHLVPDGDPINDHFETVCAYLAKDFGKSPQAVLAMDRITLYAVYYHPRDKDGNLEIASRGGGRDGPPAGPREACAARMKRFGIWEPELIAAKFASEQRERAAAMPAKVTVKPKGR